MRPCHPAGFSYLLDQGLVRNWLARAKGVGRPCGFVSVGQNDDLCFGQLLWQTAPDRKWSASSKNPKARAVPYPPKHPIDRGNIGFGFLDVGRGSTQNTFSPGGLVLRVASDSKTLRVACCVLIGRRARSRSGDLSLGKHAGPGPCYGVYPTEPGNPAAMQKENHAKKRICHNRYFQHIFT